ncbi:hypothetical protein L2E82_06825 [Cichorium intybus]|uniref:Uncharacterized protein n=1 Tax=Cichorium intybus TaxID=13427 RepID=A0ACB9HBJ5_CICIN|nr:hypothetical protein L2E82_06825 [Cichorium intybus]
MVALRCFGGGVSGWCCCQRRWSTTLSIVYGGVVAGCRFRVFKGMRYRGGRSGVGPRVIKITRSTLSTPRTWYIPLSPSAIFSTPPFKSSKFPSLFFCPNISLCLSLKLHCSSFIS